MTDKQIIIDGIDVSGCVNFIPDADTSEISYINACSIGLWQRWYSNLEPSCIMSCSCKDNPNCHYKRWQRKEQECEELKEKVKKYGEINEQETKDYAELKAENEELKKKCNIYTCGICGNKEDCNKLYKTLTEIKEIAENATKCLYVTKSDDYTDGYRWLGSIILQKISEVEDES